MLVLSQRVIGNLCEVFHLSRTVLVLSCIVVVCAVCTIISILDGLACFAGAQ